MPLTGGQHPRVAWTRVVLLPQDSDGTPRSIQDVRTDDDASPWSGQKSSILGRRIQVRSHHKRSGGRLNADRTQASTVRDAAAGEAFHCGGWFRYRVVDELGRNKDAMLVQWSADEDFLSEACQLLRRNPIQRKLWR